MELINEDRIKLELNNKSSLYKIGFIDGTNFVEKILKRDMFDFAKWCYLNNIHFVKETVEYNMNGVIKTLTIDEIINEYLKTK